MIPLVADIAIVVVLIFFAWRGATKGLILTLFSLFAVFVAWFGAKAVVGALAEPVANIIRPSIQMSIEEILEGALPVERIESSPSPSLSLSSQTEEDDDAQPASSGSDFTPQEILELLDAANLFSGIRGFLEDAIHDNALTVTTTAAAAVASYLANLIANAGLFGLSFLLILLIWYLISRALDLAFRVPILSPVNALGGAILGLTKGVLLMMVVVWLARLCGILSDKNTGPIANLLTVQGLSDLLLGLVQGEIAAFAVPLQICQTFIRDICEVI